MAIKFIKLDSLVARAVLPIIGLFCIFAVYSVMKWSFANMLATQTQFTDIAELAVDLSPNDPDTHYGLAALREDTFLPEDFEKSLKGYERAASLAPDDFRLWFDLGKARDRSGDAVGAEKAFRRALELAPHYSRNHWALGNLLLRQGNTEEAFIEIRRAVENDPSYAGPGATLAWQFYNGDVALIAQKLGDSPAIKAALSTFLAKQQRFDEAFALWNTLSADAKRTAYRNDSIELLKALQGAKKYRDVLAVQSQVIAPEGESFEVGKIFNGGFEAVKESEPSFFDWQIAAGQQPQIGYDEKQKHDGNRSLVIVFNSLNGQDFRAVQQNIAVEGGKRYRFETFARADLKSAATLKWEIVDTTDGKVLGATDAVPANSDWTALRADFTTAPNAQAVTIRLARAACPTTLCPISGRVWFDDFNLRRSE